MHVLLLPLRSMKFFTCEKLQSYSSSRLGPNSTDNITECAHNKLFSGEKKNQQHPSHPLSPYTLEINYPG